MPDIKQLAFSESEYRQRVSRVQQRMGDQQLDAILCTSLANICYLTGVESPSVHANWFTLVPAAGDPVMLLTDFESHNARVGSWLENWTTFPIGRGHLETAARLVLDNGLSGKRVAIEGGRFSSLTADDHRKLRSLLDEVKLVDTTELIERVRAVKSPAEIGYMREAGRLSEVGMQAAFDQIAEGNTDNQVAAAAYQAMIAGGSEYTCYPVFLTVGHRSGIPHTTFRRNQLKMGDPLFMEVGACICRYSSPLLRGAVIGEPNDLLRRMADACCAGVNQMVETIRPGLSGDEVAREASRCLEGLPENLVWHGYYGYSVGLGFPPSWSDCVGTLIKLDNSVILEPGMTYHCSLSLRDIGRIGTTCSETIAITETGCEVLTGNLPRELFVR